MNYFRTGSDYPSHCSTQCAGRRRRHARTFCNNFGGALILCTSQAAMPANVFSRQYTAEHLVARAVEGLLMRVLEGPGGRGAILPGLRAQVVIETRASRHGLGVEVGRERAIQLGEEHLG
uniref:Uncharacterized protein n=1 Tax=Cryptomonas curvata TaxID=233186 RepID=A0A7S0MSE5_9CRYP